MVCKQTMRGQWMAIAFRAPPKGCIHHTDRGSQYCSHDHQKILRQHGFKAEMAIVEYINGFYNLRRHHSALGWKSPVACERKVA